jgi:hypothetical protein
MEGVMPEPYGRKERAVRERAFSIWEQEGCPEGRSLSNWLQAEAEIEYEDALGADLERSTLL